MQSVRQEPCLIATITIATITMTTITMTTITITTITIATIINHIADKTLFNNIDRGPCTCNSRG